MHHVGCSASWGRQGRNQGSEVLIALLAGSIKPSGATRDGYPIGAFHLVLGLSSLLWAQCLATSWAFSATISSPTTHTPSPPVLLWYPLVPLRTLFLPSTSSVAPWHPQESV